ncbi:MAG: iron-sulfur cluster repair di-iron protein [Crocinitomicaceae bacterium]|nr:iron-sulfur cluster repair di-iron protein [Crocinitomicaceae bacterium]
MEAHKTYTSKTVGEIVAEDYRKAKVFRSYGIDFCCGGGKLLEDIISNKKIDLEQILGELHQVDQSDSELDQTNFDELTLEDLSEYIVSKHHTYTKETMEQILPLINKVARVHGDWKAELVKINNHFISLHTELTTHMMKEENVLFPYIVQLSRGLVAESPFGSIEYPIKNMELEHDVAGDLILRIEELSDNYTLPEGACNSYTVVYKLLREFQDDLMQHIHLENNILFPKAALLEKQLKN